MKLRRSAMVLCISLYMAISLTGCGLFDSVKSSVTDELGNLVVGEAQQVDTISEDKYAYSCLMDEEKSVYDQVLNAILEHADKIAVSTKDETVLEKAYNCVMADYGGLFWVSGYQFNTYTSGDTVIGLEFMPKYAMTQEERETTQAQIDSVVTEWLSGVSLNASDYDKVKYVFETLINKVDYVVDSENNQNIISVFVNEQTVCQGYADAALYLLEQLGVPSTIVTGTANGEPHAWNLVLIDGNYYFLDVTWGNSRYMDLDATEQKTINYAYMNMTSEEISATHTAEVFYTVPECTATEANYYYREGKYFDSWDADGIGSIFGNAWKNQDAIVSVKLSNVSLYDKTMSYFIDEQHISDYCRGLRQLSYIEDEGTCVLTIRLR